VFVRGCMAGGGCSSCTSTESVPACSRVCYCMEGGWLNCIRVGTLIVVV
jgi:hypothetical protein